MTIKYTKHAETSLRERKIEKDVVDGPQKSRNIGRETMRIRYDEEADALYIKLWEAEYYESDEIQEGFILDYDADENIIAVEILEASTHVPLTDLSTMNFEINRQLMKTGSNV